MSEDTPALALADRPTDYDEPMAGLAPTTGAGARVGKFLLDNGIYVALIATLVVLSFASPYFLTVTNFLNIGVAVSISGILAVGIMIGMVAGQVDVSIGAVLGLSSVVVALLLADGIPLGVAILAAIATGAGVGIFNGLLVTRLGIHSIITTLAMMMAVQGLSLLLTHGKEKQITNPTLVHLVASRPLGIPLPVWLLVGFFVAGYALLVYTRLGWHIYAAGGNPSAAARAGISVAGVTMFVLLLSGILAGLSGVITAGRTAVGSPDWGVGSEFDVLASVLLGGMTFSGGGGRIERTMAAVLLLGVLSNGLILLNVDAYYQQVVRGAVFLLAVVIEAIRHKRASR